MGRRPRECPVTAASAMIGAPLGSDLSGQRQGGTQGRLAAGGRRLALGYIAGQFPVAIYLGPYLPDAPYETGAPLVSGVVDCPHGHVLFHRVPYQRASALKEPS
jgi:hypothetical protein